MSGPVCFTCGTLFADNMVEFDMKVKSIMKDPKLSDKEKSEKRAELLNYLGYTNYCCRPRILTFIDKINF